MQLKKLQKNHKKILERLLQLYLHDISFYFPIDFDEKNGLYLYNDLDLYFESSENIGYFIKQDKKILGFILLKLTKNENQVQELFILNQHKSKGFAKLAVTNIFEKYTGNWIVKSLPCSESAEKFWHRVIQSYTNNKYNIEYVGKYNRAVFTFNNNI